MEDWQLIDEFVARKSESAFASLVSRHLNLVHSAAFRQVNDPQLAQEVAQAVFILFARKAASLPRQVILPGWLYRTTCFVARRASRAEHRRQRREQEAFEMQQISSTADDTWRSLAPILDDAIEQLGETDRNAVILRFFQDKPLQEVGHSLGITEEAARKRVGRSLEKLRSFFGRRGFTITAAVLATCLAEHSLEAAPAQLGVSISSNALAHGAAVTSLPVLVRETLNAWRWAKLKLAVGVGSAALVTGLLLFNTLSTSTPKSTAPLSTSGQPAPASAETGKAIAATTPVPASVTNSSRFAFQAVDAGTGKGIAGARVLSLVAQDQDHIDLRTNLITDSEGRCDVPLPFSNIPLLAVGVLADGYEQRCVFAGSRGGQDTVPTGYVLKLPRGARIGGIVQDEAGKPVADAAIHVQFDGTGDADWREFQRERPGFPADDLPIATTDRSGHWTFGSAPATNGNFSISVKYGDFPQAAFLNDGDEHRFTEPDHVKIDDLHAGKAVLVLKRGLGVRGIVTDERQLQVSGADVRFGQFFGSSNPSSTTTNDGSFNLPNLSAGPGHVTIIAPGFAPERLAVTVSPDAAPLAVELKPGAWLRLRVVNDSGHAMPRVRVQLQEWRGNNSLEWGGFTDDAGRLEWAQAPHDKMNFATIKEGFFFSRNNWVEADGEEHTITLHTQLVVTGLVTDVETKQPIATFKAIPGSDPEYWERHNLTYGTNGQYKLAFDEYRPPFQIRFEADGYEPAVSEPLDQHRTNQTLNYFLRRQNPRDSIQGIVLLPDGNPASGAQVGLCTPEKGIILGRAKFLYQDNAVVTTADAAGQFSFPSGLLPHTLVAIHQQGFQRIVLNQTNRVLTVELQPWGRIEGNLNLKNRPNASQQITFYSTPGPFPGGALSLDLGAFSTKTDDQGHFVFEQLPSGDFDLYLVPGLGIPFRNQTPVQVVPGETLHVQIGGTGRTLSGRFVLSSSIEGVDWKKQIQFASIGTKLPPLPIPQGLPAREMMLWQREFAATEEGRARARATHGYPLDVQSDGTFIIEDVLPGAYSLSAELFDSTVNPQRPFDSPEIGSARHELTVPDAAESTPSEPLDIGSVTVTVFNRQARAK